MTEQAEFAVKGTVLGIVVENYEQAVFPPLVGARDQLDDIANLLSGFGYEPEVVRDPVRDEVRDAVGDWQRTWREKGGNGPAIVVWSGHGKKHRNQLRLITRETKDWADSEHTYRVELLAEAALRSGADQILLIVDTCYSGAGVLPSVEEALSAWAEQSLPGGRAAWLGVIASCQPDELAEGRGTLLDTVADVLREGPRTDHYKHLWSVHNRGVTGETVIGAVLAQMPAGGQLPLQVNSGRSLPMFHNPRWRRDAPEQLVEHLVLAARGADPTEEGWFFTGRRDVLTEIVSWLGERKPGLFLVTGSAGSGKSAVLGRIATLSDKEQRKEAKRHGALEEGDPDPGESSVDASVHLRGLDAQRLAEVLAQRLGLPVPKTPSALIAEIEGRGAEHPAALLLDGLDEAAPEQATAIVEQLLVPLSRIATVLLGSRDRPFRPLAEPREPLDETLRRLLGAAVHIADLDGELGTGADVRAYVERRLRAGGVSGERSAGTANGLTERATGGAGGFLFARLVTGSLLRRFRQDGEGDWTHRLPSSIAEALADDLASGPTLERDGRRIPLGADDLLTALAWSSGPGMPARGIWEIAASAVSAAGTEYGPDDVDWVLGAYGRYVVEDTDGTQAVYRLYHREFVDHLRRVSRRRETDGAADPALGIAEALVTLLRRETDDTASPEKANPYLSRELTAHAVAAGGPGVELLRTLVELNGERFLPDLAAALLALGVRVPESGNPEEALAPSREAVVLYHALAEERPGIHQPALAVALGNLARLLALTGDREGGLEHAREAVAVRRELTARNPTAYRPYLASALGNLARHLGDSGDRSAALESAQEAVDMYRSVERENPAAHLPDLATALGNLANYQADAGDSRRAVVSAREAVTLRRSLAAANPTAFLPDLATGVSNLSVHLAATGDWRGAHAHAREAADRFRALADENPAAHRRRLAGALSNLANRLADGGDHQGSLGPAHEAIAIRRSLVQQDPACLPDLAMSLNNLANHLADGGDRQSALACAREATGLYRTLAHRDPAVHLPDLAMSLGNLATSMANAGDREGSLGPAHEAVSMYQALAQQNPAAHLPRLAATLNNLAMLLAGNGDRRSALVPAQEATAMYHALAQDNPGAHLPDLANSLNNLANHLADGGDRRNALASAQEATAMYRALAQDNPGAHLPDLAMSLTNLANHLAGAGERPAALDAAREAVALRRELAARNPPAHLPDLAMSLNNLGDHLAKGGDGQAALEAAHEAVGTYRTLAGENAAAFVPGLAMSVSNLAVRLAEAGERPAALDAAREAVALRRELAARNPPAHLLDLATSLNNLAIHLAEDGRHDLAEAAYTETEQALAGHPGAARHIAFARASFRIGYADAETGVEELTALAAAPPGENDLAFAARHRLRLHAATGPDEERRVATVWNRATGTGPPAWLTLSADVLDLVGDWIDCPTWTASRAFWTAHADALDTPEVALALQELALVTEAAEPHLRLLLHAVAAGPDAAFRPYLLDEVLDVWLSAPSWDESRTRLTTHAAVLLQDDAEQALAGAENDPTALGHAALIHLARADGIPAAYACATSRTALHDRVGTALTTPSPDTLRHCAALEQAVFLDEFAAHVHRAVADVLSGGGTPVPVPADPPTAEDRDRAVSQIAALIGRQPEHAEHLSTLLRAVLATTPAA